MNQGTALLPFAIAGWALALHSGRVSVGSAGLATLLILPPAWKRFEPAALVAYLKVTKLQSYKLQVTSRIL